jgi:hypothetical protein
MAFQFAESVKGCRLEDREAYNCFKETPLPSNDKDGAGELVDYVAVNSLDGQRTRKWRYFSRNL